MQTGNYRWDATQNAADNEYSTPHKTGQLRFNLWLDWLSN